MLVDDGQGLVRIDVAENGNDHVIGHEVFVVILLQIFGRKSFDRFGFAVQQNMIRRSGGQAVVEKFGDLRLGAVGPAGDCT